MDGRFLDLGHYLLQRGYITLELLQQAREVEQRTGGDLARILVDLGVNPTHIFEAKAQEMSVPFVDLTVFQPEPSALNVVPEEVARRHNGLPIKKDGNTLYVAMGDTNNLTAADDLRLVSRCRIRGVLAVPEYIADKIDRLYGQSG